MNKFIALHKKRYSPHKKDVHEIIVYRKLIYVTRTAWFFPQTAFLVKIKFRASKPL